MALIVSVVLFLIFGSNVIAGSFFGAPFFSDIMEMLVLFASAIAFVAAILNREARNGENSQQ